MKRGTQFLFVLMMVLLNATNILAQKVYTINVGNERLLLLCEQLIAKNVKAERLNEADTSFTNAIAHKLDSIKGRALERRSFIKKLKRVNASALPTTFNHLTFSSLNNRLKREDKPLASDYAYCNVIEKILTLTKKFKKNKKVYFAAGKYAIPEELKPRAKEIFQPIIDDFIRLSNLFKDLPFKAIVRTTGYADNAQINQNSDLYNEMSKRLQSDNLSSEEINTYLSYMRSYDVSNLLRKIMKEKKKYLFEPENLNVKYDKIGLGGQMPPGDGQFIPAKKRRVVYVYWHILPNF